MKSDETSKRDIREPFRSCIDCDCEQIRFTMYTRRHVTRRPSRQFCTRSRYCPRSPLMPLPCARASLLFFGLAPEMHPCNYDRFIAKFAPSSSAVFPSVIFMRTSESCSNYWAISLCRNAIYFPISFSSKRSSRPPTTPSSHTRYKSRIVQVRVNRFDEQCESFLNILSYFRK